VRRRSFAWVVATLLALIGSQVAHALAYDIAAIGSRQRAHLLEESGHGYLSYVPLCLALATVIVVLALVSEVRLAAAGSAARTPALWSFAAFAPLVFVCQEHFERLLHDGVFPWGAVAEPTFAIGLALQLPFALLAYLAARLLLRAARSLGRLFARPIRASAPDSGNHWHAAVVAPLRRAVLSLGYGTRGPPFLVPA
jgi:hypothetical protein